jgi:1,4-dihydroxy-6-naphthoate synthase
MKKLRFGFSPCPNDTFILDALVNGKIKSNLEDINIEWVIEDVQELNNRVLNQELEVSKMSYGVYPLIADNYSLLTAGSALGKGCGPLLIYNKEPIDMENARIAIPGINTTANFLLQTAYPTLKKDQKIEVLFSEIEEMLLNDEVDFGLIIHESRFTYKEKGLHLMKDLGAYWEESTGMHIPLGGFSVHRGLEADLQARLDNAIKRSVLYAFEHPESGKEWIKKHSQELEDEVINSHIELYVNQYSIDLGKDGRESVQYLLEKDPSFEKKSKNIQNIFVQ